MYLIFKKNMFDKKLLNAFTQISHKNLINIMKDLPGPKDLIIEHTLFKPLEMFIDMKSLRYDIIIMNLKL